MQINFYMGDQDRKGFHSFIFSRGGYLVPEYYSNQITLVDSEAENTLLTSKCLKIFKEDIFPKENFSGKEWVTYQKVRKEYYVHGPGMEYFVSYQDEKGIHRGRIYMGLVGPFSFVKPGAQDPDAYDKYKDSYKSLENFYKACCRYIRKNYRKDLAGTYHGPESDLLETEHHVSKSQI